MQQAREVFEAAESGDARALRKLLAAGARTDHTDEARRRAPFATPPPTLHCTQAISWLYETLLRLRTPAWAQGVVLSSLLLFSGAEHSAPRSRAHWGNRVCGDADQSRGQPRRSKSGADALLCSSVGGLGPHFPREVKHSAPRPPLRPSRRAAVTRLSLAAGENHHRARLLNTRLLIAGARDAVVCSSSVGPLGGGGGAA